MSRLLYTENKYNSNWWKK